MKVHLARLFTALLLGGAISNAVASVDEGVAAYEQKNYALALEKFRTEANAGNAKAQAWLGFIYDNGQGVPKDDKQAVAWYRKAADQGDADAQNNLGFSYESGQGTPRNIVIANTPTTFLPAWMPQAIKKPQKPGSNNRSHDEAEDCGRAGAEPRDVQARKFAESAGYLRQGEPGAKIEVGSGSARDFRQQPLSLAAR